jgi:Asp-tRNA(Asn)/Glu-tRNA(Gln) amidotransferase A subunit family amidase
MPLGVQVVGAPKDDARVLAAAAWVEKALAPAGPRARVSHGRAALY